MLPIQKLLCGFERQVTFWYCVPKVIQGYGPELFICVLVKPETSLMDRDAIKDTLIEGIDRQEIWDAYVDGLLDQAFVIKTPRIVVAVRLDRTPR